MFFSLIRISENRPKPHAFNILAYIPLDWKIQDGFTNLKDYMHLPAASAQSIALEHWEEMCITLSKIELH